MIEITLDDFIYNAGILGLYRIFEHANLPCELKGQTLKFDERNLENFEEYYFSYLAHEHGFDTSYQKMMDSKTLVENCMQGIQDEKQLNQLNELIENMKRWLTSNSYKNIYSFLTEIPYNFEAAAKTFKKIALKKKETLQDVQPQIVETVTLIRECLEYLSHPQAKRYIVPRTLSYQVIQGFWTNVSLLNSSASKKDLYVEYEHYFTKAALAFLETKKDEKKYAKNKLHCASCENKMRTSSEAFDLTWLQKVGVDAARKSSHYWDYQRDIFICPICNLVYSCVPLGFKILKGKGLFINNNSSVRELISVNSISIRDGKEEVSRDQLESIAYYKILDLMVQQAENKKELEIDNIQIVKFDRNQESRPYTFNILSREKAKLLADMKADFQQLVGKFAKENNEYISIYQEVMRRLYNGQSFYDLLYRLLRLVIDEDYKGTQTLFKILKIQNNIYKGGDHFMTQEDLNNVRKYGYHLKHAYRGQESKLNGISYRLLNAIKVKNSNKFMETLIQAYSYQKQPIPAMFVQALADQEKFQTIGYAFLLGLHGYENKENDKGEHKDE